MIMNIQSSLDDVNGKIQNNLYAIGERIISLVGSNSSSQNKFAKLIGASANTISNWATGKTSPRLDMFLKICEITGRDPTWLLTGKEPLPTVSIDDGPYFRAPVAGQAGAGTPIINPIEERTDTAVLSNAIRDVYGAGEYITVWVRGDSMAPLIPPGSLVAVRKEHIGPAALNWNHVYLVNIPNEEGGVLKKVTAEPEAGTLTLHSINSAAYPPETYSVKHDRVTVIGRVVGIVWAPQ
jgi:transcriptional regulator with XRE-family HTH domain